MDRGATVTWSVDAGTITTDSGALVNMPYSPRARYELEAMPSATTPEELLASAFASCFTMTLVEKLRAAGYSVPSLRAEARVQLVHPSGFWEIPAIRVHCTATVPGISERDFLAIAHEARTQGAIARTLRAEITLTVSLERASERQWQLPLQRG
jgi:osmotically inducible protein OsmC